MALPERTAPELQASEEVTLRIRARGPVRADWIHVMAQYRWPAHRVLAVTVEGQGRSGPPAERLRNRTPELSTLSITVDEPASPTPSASTVPDWTAGWSVSLLELLALLGLCTAGLVGLAQGRELAGASPDLRFPLAACRAAEAVLLLALGLFVWKVIQAPLWSWDHHAIWGMKARRLAAEGLHPGWLAPPAFPYAAPDYPLGWPVASAAVSVPLSAFLTLGRIPGAVAFKSLHVVCGLALAFSVHRLLRRAGSERFGSATAAALVAASPLLWDTESLGLADLPLALAAMAALVLVLGARSELRDGRTPLVPLALAGLVVGLLPWIKQEGWTLAPLLVAASALLLRAPGATTKGGRRYLLALAPPAMAMWILQPLAHAPFTAPGTGFLAGDWTARALARLALLPELIGRMALELLDPAWLGLWALFAVALGLAVLRGRRLPPARGAVVFGTVVLGAVVVIQLVIYTFVYLATYLDPFVHLDSSFVRIAGALAPWAVAVVFTYAASEAQPGEASASSESAA